MRAITKPCLLLIVAAVASTPIPARADGFITPWIGASISNENDEGHRAFGVTGGYMGAGVFGFEGDFGYSPDFPGPAGVSRATLMTLTGNFILGLPFGGVHGPGVRPYVSAGLGLMRAHAEDAPSLRGTSWTNNQFCSDVGAGMMGFFNQHVGVRGEVRYFHGLRDSTSGSGVDLEPGRLQYWRLSGGVTFR